MKIEISNSDKVKLQNLDRAIPIPDGTTAIEIVPDGVLFYKGQMPPSFMPLSQKISLSVSNIFTKNTRIYSWEFMLADDYDEDPLEPL